MMVVHCYIEFVKYLPRPKVAKKKRLVGSSAEQENQDGKEDAVVDDSYISYWTKNLTINIVADDKPIPFVSLPPFMQQGKRVALGKDFWKRLNLAKDIRIEHTDVKSKVARHYPIVHVNEFWTTAAHLMPINETVTYVAALLCDMLCY
jgi:hypothetical protein